MEEWKLDKLLKAYIEEPFYVAGAICWFNQEDSGPVTYVMDCLGFLDGCCCPHDGEKIEPSVHEFINDKN